MPDPSTDKPPIDVERGAGLYAQVTFIEQRPGLDGARAAADRETQARRDRERAGRIADQDYAIDLGESRIDDRTAVGDLEIGGVTLQISA